MNASPRTERNERAREGGGAPPDRHDEKREASQGSAPGQGASPVASESSVVNRRDIPGGNFRPAVTPGALGPTTRGADYEVASDANHTLVARIALTNAGPEKGREPSH